MELPIDAEKCACLAVSVQIIFARLLIVASALFYGLALGDLAVAQSGLGFATPGGYALKIYRVNYGAYPFVEVYFRTFDQKQQPLINLNERNIGLMVKGKSYDPMKRQYFIQPLRQRQESTRTVLVLDASRSMAGPPFEAALRASVRYIDSKRPQDEIAVLSIRDSKEGYELISDFERDAGALGRRLADVRADGQKTRLYDSIGAAMQMCAMTAQGSMAPGTEHDVASCSIVVFSDGLDEGSALSREELNARITSLSIPVPIYSLAYSKVSKQYFKNLESLSKNSFGIYYLIGQTVDRMQQVVEEIQNIVQSDYVVTFRSYVPVDGEEHGFKLGVEYPSGSGKIFYENSRFEAIEPPPLQPILQKVQLLNQAIPALPAGVTTPYFDQPTPAGSVAPETNPPAAPMISPGSAGQQPQP